MNSGFRFAQDALGKVRGATKHILANIRRCVTPILVPPEAGDEEHPWYTGFTDDGIVIPDTILGHPLDPIDSSMDISAPILFIARGHSGTRALAKLLEMAGVYIGNAEDKNSLNDTYDSLYWAYGFQRTLVPRLFKWGEGCFVDENIAMTIGLECLRRHLGYYSNGPWGFKTCAGMFSHTLYRYIFPRAKYIYLVRDGRDVILSGGGIIHLTGSSPAHPHWEYFKICTFGISNDLHSCPFKLPGKQSENNELIRNKYWIQAKSWREHVCMVEYLKKTEQLSPNVHMVRYEELCREPIPILEHLFDFLDIELTDDVKRFAIQLFHPKSIGRWKEYKRYVNDCGEDMEKVFASMQLELELLSYTR